MTRLLFSFVTLCILWINPSANAGSFPDKPVRLIVPFPPGGGSTALTRILAKKLTEIWGQPLVVENHGGAQGSVGAAMGSRAAPDGYTITFVAHNILVLNPYMSTAVSYDALTDFAPIIMATEQEYLLVASPMLPVKSMKDVVDMARANPGKLTFASSSTAPQLVGELIKKIYEIDMLHVPYNGGGPASVALMSGEINLMIANPTSLIPLIKSNKVHAIAVLGKVRNHELPDVPTAVEQGFSEIADVPEWYGFVAPAKTPPAIIAKLNADFVKALTDPEVRNQILALGLNPKPSTPEEFGAIIKDDYFRWGRIAKDAGLSVR